MLDHQFGYTSPQGDPILSDNPLKVARRHANPSDNDDELFVQCTANKIVQVFMEDLCSPKSAAKVFGSDSLLSCDLDAVLTSDGEGDSSSLNSDEDIAFTGDFVPLSDDAKSDETITTLADEKRGLVRSLTVDKAAASLELSAVLASYDAVLTKDHTQASIREHALALINRTLDPESFENFYIYDLGVVTRLHAAWTKALPRVTPHYAVKCNSDVGLIATLAALGTGFDCASQTEVDLCLDLGVSADRIIYANCCKFPREMRHAAARGVSLSVIDSRSELQKTAIFTPGTSLLLRIHANDPNARCQLSNKYGAAMEDVDGLLSYAMELGLSIVGVSFHVGSGATSSQAFVNAIDQARAVFDKAEALGFSMNVLDLGGGFMSMVHNDGSVTFKGDISGAINKALDIHFPVDSGVKIIAEPGRYFAEYSATMACCIFGHRERKLTAGGGLDYYITDGLYGSFNGILYDHSSPVCEPLRSPFLPAVPEDPPSETWSNCTVFGPTCDGMDMVFKDTCRLPELRNGDWLLFPNSGAYSIAGATNFNGIKVVQTPSYYVFSA